jgi:DNA-binding LytR/AlgR family response regulator
MFFSIKQLVMKCIVVDDNKMARMAIQQMIEQVGFLELKHECSNPIEAFNYLKTEEIDLVFLDVEMPGMSGVELIKNLDKRPIIILITGKKDYAIEAFELNVADYIMKPVSLARFTKAVERAKELYDNNKGKSGNIKREKEYIFARSNNILSKIKIDDIKYIQALGDYVNIFTDDKRYTVHITLKGIEEKLPHDKFYRLHRSYITSLNHIDNIEESTAYIGKHPLPIGEQFKKELLKRLNLI